MLSSESHPSYLCTAYIAYLHSSVCATLWFYHHLSYNLGLPSVMDVLKSLVQPLVGGAGGSSVVDGMKLVVLGGTVETARRVSSSAWCVCRCTPFLSCSLSSSPGPTLSTVSSPFPSLIICTHHCPTQHSFSPHTSQRKIIRTTG